MFSNFGFSGGLHHQSDALTAPFQACVSRLCVHHLCSLTCIEDLTDATPVAVGSEHIHNNLFVASPTASLSLRFGVTMRSSSRGNKMPHTTSGSASARASSAPSSMGAAWSPSSDPSAAASFLAPVMENDDTAGLPSSTESEWLAVDFATPDSHAVSSIFVQAEPVDPPMPTADPCHAPQPEPTTSAGSIFGAHPNWNPKAANDSVADHTSTSSSVTGQPAPSIFGRPAAFVPETRAELDALTPEQR
eukprot:389926-Amphidinium_carterae.1